MARLKWRVKRNIKQLNATPKKRKGKALFWLLAAMFLAAGIFIFVGFGSSWFTISNPAKWYDDWGEGAQIEQPEDDENPTDKSGEDGQTEDEGDNPEYEIELEESEK